MFFWDHVVVWGELDGMACLSVGLDRLGVNPYPCHFCHHGLERRRFLVAGNSYDVRPNGHVVAVVSSHVVVPLVRVNVLQDGVRIVGLFREGEHVVERDRRVAARLAGWRVKFSRLLGL